MKKSVKKISLIVFSLCLLLFAVAGCSDSAAKEEDKSAETKAESKEITTGAKVGQRLLETTFNKMVSEDKVTLPIKGKVTIINLWATWCPPCQDEMPEIQKFYEKNTENSNVAFYSINLGEADEEIESFFNLYKLSFPVLVDYDEKSIKMLVTNGIPTTVVTNADGVVVFRRVGPVTLKELETAVAKAQK